MRVSATNYLLLGVASFAAFFGIQALVVSYCLPMPAIKDLSHPLEVIGTYTYSHGSRGGNSTWVNNKRFYCGGGALGYYSCVGYINGLPQQAPITLKFVNLKTIDGTVPVAMNVKSSGKELFSQTPLQYMSAWKSQNNFYFSSYSLIIALVVVGVTHIYLTRNKMT
ncbi:hypothetical protein ISP15_18020 [Dyella jejuensis]|uniref:Uncharacterized protein n=1 Tax=Dyella jejuensis TaxID=1432009 RepID=A0ABW8JP37_9GAMM